MSVHTNESQSDGFIRIVYTFDSNISLILTATIGCTRAESLLECPSMERIIHCFSSSDITPDEIARAPLIFSNTGRIHNVDLNNICFVLTFTLKEYLLDRPRVYGGLIYISTFVMTGTYTRCTEHPQGPVQDRMHDSDGDGEGSIFWSDSD